MKQKVIENENNQLFISDPDFWSRYFHMTVFIKSDLFQGVNRFFVYEDCFIEFIRQAEIMYNSLEGSCILRDDESDSHIEFEFKKYGRLKISGMIGGTFRDNYMYFKFYEDQTSLYNFLETIKTIFNI